MAVVSSCFASSLLLKSSGRVLQWGALLFSALILNISCAARQAKKPDKNEKLIPDETQYESEQLYGQQEILMNDLSMSTSEQAGARHDRAVRRSRNPDEERSNSK